jgi:hypothetical protein
MKKSGLRSGMMVEFTTRSQRALILLNSNQGDVTCDLTPEHCDYGGYRHCNYYGLDKYNDDLTEKTNVTGDIIRVYNEYGQLLWERPEKTFIKLDGVEYSESTLRSLIKKATE